VSHFIEVDDLKSAYVGGVLGSTGCGKGTKRLSKLVNAAYASNDNVPYSAMKIAA